MDQSHYSTLLEEVQNDIAEAEQAIEELRHLESYLRKKLSGGGGSNRGKAASAPQKKPTMQGGGGMQTVEFGPDGFPST